MRQTSVWGLPPKQHVSAVVTLNYALSYVVILALSQRDMAIPTLGLSWLKNFLKWLKVKKYIFLPLPWLQRRLLSCWTGTGKHKTLDRPHSRQLLTSMSPGKEVGAQTSWWQDGEEDPGKEDMHSRRKAAWCHHNSDWGNLPSSLLVTTHKVIKIEKTKGKGQ